MKKRTFDRALQFLKQFSNKSVTTEDVVVAEKKSVNLNDRMKDFHLLLSIFKDAVSGRYKISKATMATIGGAILYVVSPIDAIPDFLPLIGWTDDIAVVGFVVARLAKEIENYKLSNGK